MNELQQELFEKQIISLAKELDYPRTPAIAGSVMERLRAVPSPTGRGVRGEGRSRSTLRARRLTWSLSIILLLIASLMLIPPVRAAVIEFIQIGVVRIFRAEPTPVSPPTQEFPVTMIPVTATPAITAQPLLPILERLAGEMTMEEARQTVGYPILLPSYPTDLGPPDRVFVQEAEGKLTILVWVDPQEPEQIRMSLHLIPPGSWAIDKVQPVVIEETTVNGQRAVWAVGPYAIRFRNANMDFIRLIEGHVLIWTNGDVTYRLETDLSLEEAVKIAESLQPIR